MRTMFSTQKPHRPRSALSGREQLLRRHDLLETGPASRMPRATSGTPRVT